MSNRTLICWLIVACAVALVLGWGFALGWWAGMYFGRALLERRS